MNPVGVLAESIVCAMSLAWAAGSAGEAARPGPARYDEAMAAARGCYAWRSSSVLNRPKIDFAAAREQFRMAAGLATNGAGRAAAFLALADSRLHDYRETDYASIRADYERVLALPGAASRGLCAWSAWTVTPAEPARRRRG